MCTVAKLGMNLSKYDIYNELKCADLDREYFGSSLFSHKRLLGFFWFFCFFFPFSFIIHMCIQGLVRFTPPAPTPSLTTHSAPSLSPPSIPRRNYFALISNFVVERV
jgi:hypothetical protein